MKTKVSKITNMTDGSPVRLILMFAVPLLIGNVFQQIYNLVDTMIAGHFLGENAIAAIGATGVIYSLLMNIAWGLNNGYCIILSRAFGAGEKKHFRNAVTAMITTVAYNACSGYLRAIGNSRIPLYFLILSSLLNLILDIVFIVVLKSGIAGAAWATVIAQAVSALSCGVYILKNYRDYLPEAQDFRPGKDMLSEMFSTGFSMALMQSVFSFGSVILQRAINELGTAIITAHTASRRVYEMLMIPMSTIATANSTFVGQNYGAKKYRRIIEANRKMLVVEFLWSLFSIMVSWVFGRMLVVWLTATSNELIVSNALLNLRMSTACFFPLGALFILRYSMQAMGHKVLPVLSSTIELVVKIISAAVLVPALGYFGVTVTEPVIWCICAMFLGIFYVTIGHQKGKE